MSRDGGPAPNPQPSPHALAQVTLHSCREDLRAAIRLLSMLDPNRPDAASSSGTSEASLIQDFQSAEQAYDDLVINISHDVKTSLTVIRGHAQMMARAIRRGDAIDHDALLATLQTIDTSAQRISKELDSRIGGGSSDPG
jgi:signal transduction histidine kinase